MSRTLKTILITFVITAALFSSHAEAQSIKDNQIHYITDNVHGIDSLIRIFRGRIIYIDMWATWCHPCKMELQDKKRMSEFAGFAAKNNIVLLYLCMDKNDKSWRQFIRLNKLYGYHLLVSDSLSKELHKRLSYSQIGKTHLRYGFYIPRHMIIDRNGEIADSLADAQGAKSVYNLINSLLIKPIDTVKRTD